MTVLKPCPFCGSSRRLVINCEDGDYYVDFWYVYCKSCGAYMESTKSEIDVIEKWNRRAGDDQ